MASSPSSPSRNWRYGVFVSFHGPDVRKTFLSHLRKQFSHNGITMFDDHEIKRGKTIAPEILKAIRESRISIVVFSKNYASSSWCLEDLVEIMKCREEMGQIVMTVFYGADSSDVRKQTGDFGMGFSKACSYKTKEERLRWSQALNYAANIVGEDFGNCDNEADLIEKVSRDVSDKLNAATISRDFEDKVGMEAHLQKMQSLLHFDTEEGTMIVGICGPAGMLQEKLLSKILNQNGMKISHLGAIEERLSNLKVLIILDDVDDLKQLEALAKETNWFGRGSRIIVTTEDEELLLQHGIDSNSTYNVDFPTSEEALEIFCRYAFRQNYPDNGFKELAERVVDLCDNLPLSLSMVGSSLRGKKEEVWEKVMRKLETTTDHRDIEQVLRAVYEQSSSSNKRKRKSKSRHFTVMAFFVVINMLLEIASAVTDQLSSTRKPYFTRISLVMSVLSVFLSILDLTYKIKAHKASFRCKWPIPWFYLPARGYRRIFGSFTDTVLLFCVLGGLIVSTVNYCFVVKGENGPIKVSSIWPLFFAIGMVASKFMEKPLISKDYSL